MGKFSQAICKKEELLACITGTFEKIEVVAERLSKRIKVSMDKVLEQIKSFILCLENQDLVLTQESSEGLFVRLR